MSQAVLWVLASTWRPCRLFLLFRLYVARNGVVRDVLTHRWSAFWQNRNGHVDLNFQQYSAGDVLSDLGNGVHIRAIKKDRATKKWIPGQAMIFDSDFPTGQDVSQPHMIYEGKWQWELDSLKNSLLRPCRTIWEHLLDDLGTPNLSHNLGQYRMLSCLPQLPDRRYKVDQA